MYNKICLYLKINNNQKGFSLVELMIVVSIIGILASIAVPQFQKFIFKARQTEAKAGLSSIYSAEKAFFGEWSQYDVRFEVIGYRPEGNLYYRLGFSGDISDTTTSTNYKNGGGAAPTEEINKLIDTNSYCATVNPSPCRVMSSADGVTELPAEALVANSTTEQSTFVAAALASGLNPSDSSGTDTWTIDYNKSIKNGLPESSKTDESKSEE